MKTPSRAERKLRQALITGVITAAAGIVGVAGANIMISVWSAGHIAESVEGAQERPVAIVLGTRVRSDGTPSDALADRLDTALALYQQGKVQRILVSGDHGSDAYDEVNAMFYWLVDRGVPREHVFTDHAGFRTLDTMVRAADVFEVRSALIVTQRFHLGRAVYLAQAAGIDAFGVAAEPVRYTGGSWNHVRETIARTVAVADVVLGRGPRYLGERIPIDGPAVASHDHAARDE